MLKEVLDAIAGRTRPMKMDEKHMDEILHYKYEIFPACRPIYHKSSYDRQHQDVLNIY